jgi:nitrile hydratase subunit beta
VSYHSHADLGGAAEQRAVLPERESDKFHADWEARVMALTVAMGAARVWNIDMTRSARETLPDYAKLSYYEIWLAGLEKLVRSKGLLDRPGPATVPMRASDVAAVLNRGSPTQRHGGHKARFALGNAVRTRAAAVDHHTRLPAYARGKLGTVERTHGMHIFADTNAQGLGEAPQHLYTVSFAAAQLWGSEAPDPGALISIDAWESYLEAV